VLDAARDRLGAHYAAELGEPFVSAGLCYYRDGRDSVAWHGDRIGRGDHQDTMVAIVSLGEPRPLLLRPRGGGGTTVRQLLGHGDLIVMGGSCQRTWDHAIPKTRADVGGRISVQFRRGGGVASRGRPGRSTRWEPAGRWLSAPCPVSCSGPCSGPAPHPGPAHPRRRRPTSR